MLILVIDDWPISCEIALPGMSQDLTDDKSTLIQVMAWCRQATSHYLSQCWPRSLSPYGIIRPQWVKHCLNCLLPLIISIPLELAMHLICQNKWSFLFGQWITVKSHEHHGIWNHWQINCFSTVFSAQQQRNTKPLQHWPFVRKIFWWQWIPLIKSQSEGFP